MTDADIYVATALQLIEIASEAGGLKSAQDLRSWWGAEAERRSEYGLTEDQEQTLISACKAKIEGLDPAPAKKQQTKRRAPSKRPVI